MKMVGERPLNAIMDSIDDLRKVKVKEAYEKATVKSKVGAGAAPKASAPPPTKDAPKKKGTAKKAAAAAPMEYDDEEKPAAKKPPGRLAVRILFSPVNQVDERVM